MAFYSIAFLGFILIFVIIHEIIGRLLPDHQWMVRLIAGLVFFTYLSGAKIIFIIISAFSIWGGAILISRKEIRDREYRKQANLTKEEKKTLKKKSERIQTIYAAIIIIINLSLLICSKYFMPVIYHPVALPLGISFYTLQAVSYVVDVFRGKYNPQHNPGKVLLYLCWFPQLIQGPINRYDLIESDLYRPYKINAPDFRIAFYIFLFGAVKKYAIADLLAPLVNSSLNDRASEYPGCYLLFGAFLYAIEQYADFSGGIDMALGTSLLFGVKMSDNFKQPYFSTSLAKFWRRWHITLGSWMRDYIFYPFATSKPISKMSKYINKHLGNHMSRSITGGLSNILVFSLVGLWHGPELHYLAWGLYNGVIIALSEFFSPLFVSLNQKFGIKEDGKGLYLFRIVRTFMIIVFAGYFDVLGSVRLGISCFINTFFRFDLAHGSQMISGLLFDGITSVESITTASICTLLLIVNSICKERGLSPLGYICSRKYILRWGVCFALTLLLLYSFTVSAGNRGFMYAAF